MTETLTSLREKYAHFKSLRAGAAPPQRTAQQKSNPSKAPEDFSENTVVGRIPAFNNSIRTFQNGKK
jgi:hypothetical protein